MDSDESSSSPQLKGFVIITLPPPDNPSLGKTITAFTLSESDHNPSPPLPNPHHQNHLPAQSPTGPPRNFTFSFRSSVLYRQRALTAFLAISVLACLIFSSSSFSKTLLESVPDSEEDKDRSSLLFPLFSKVGYGDDAEVKLGRFVDDGVRIKEGSKLGVNYVAIDKSAVFPVKGNVYPDGLYFTSMLIGNPPRPYYLDIDTGSDLTWIQCDAPCTSCAKGAHPLYKPTKGNILPYKDSLCTEIQRSQKSSYCETCQQCDYEIEYADHSSSMGVLAKDELHLTFANGSETKYDVVFGCSYDQQGLLLNSLGKTDGILGLGRAKVSLPSQLAMQGIINNVVGHCLSTKAGGGGYLFLGNDFLPYWGITWVPMLDIYSEDIYSAEMVKMSYGYRHLSLDRSERGVGRAAFDSGSSYTYFPKHEYNDLVTALEEVSDELVRDASDPTMPICWRAESPIRSISEVKQFYNTLTLDFGSKWWIGSTKFQIPPEGYLIISNKGNVCLGILDGTNLLDGSTVVLGDISMRGLLVVYDNTNNKIGWARSNCVQPKRSKSLTDF